MGKGEKNIHLKQQHAQLGLIKLSESEPFHFLSVSYICETEKIHTLHTMAYSPLCLNGGGWGGGGGGGVGETYTTHTHNLTSPISLPPHPFPIHRGNSFLTCIFE